MSDDVLQDGVKLYKEGKITEAVDKLKEYLAQKPADIAARTYLGAALGQLNRYPEAAEEFLCLTRLEPGNIRHYYNLGQAYEAFDSDLQAIGAYEKALQIEPDHTKSKERIKVIETKQKNVSETQAVAPPSPQPAAYEPPVPWSQPGVPQQPTVQPYGAPPPPQNYNPQQTYGAPPPPYQNNAPTGMGYNVQPQNMQYAMPDWLVVLLLLLITPVGIIFMWWKSRWSSGAKWVVTVVWATLIFVGFGSVNNVMLRKQEEARQSSCASHLKMIGLATMMYAQDYDEHLPAADKWNDLLIPYVNGESAYQCPDSPQMKCGYAYNASLLSLSDTALATISDPATTETCFDASADWNTNGGWDIAAYRHGNGLNVSYADGHVKWSAMPKR